MGPNLKIWNWIYFLSDKFGQCEYLKARVLNKTDFLSKFGDNLCRNNVLRPFQRFPQFFLFLYTHYYYYYYYYYYLIWTHVWNLNVIILRKILFFLFSEMIANTDICFFNICLKIGLKTACLTMSFYNFFRGKQKARWDLYY